MPTGELPTRAYEPVYRWARIAAERTAFVDFDGHRFGFGELAMAIDAMTETLARHGVRAGDRLLIVGENCVGAVIALFAAQRLDAWPAMVNARIPGRDIAAMGRTVQARATLYVADGSTAARDHAAAAGLATAAWPCGSAALSAIDPAVAPEPTCAEPERQVGLLLFTSGTTGRPKAVMLGHRALLNTGMSAAEARRIGPEDCLYGAAPLSHVMGIAFFVMTSLWAGAVTRLVPRLDLADLTRAIAGREISFLMGVPTLFARLLDHAEPRGIDLSGHGLRNIIAGGAPLDGSLKQRVERAFAAPLGNGLAMTECTPVLRTMADTYAEPESVGVPQGGTEIRLVADGRDVADGAIGELWVRGPSLMLGYYRDPQATARAFRPGGWFATGDLARRLPNGDYALVGRIKDIIIRSGFNVHPGEVEAAIASHPAVAQCAVVGRPASGGDESIVAFVQPLPGKTISEAEILTHLGPWLAPYKRPSHILFLDSLPIGPTGKIWKSQLAEMAANEFNEGR